MVACSWLGMDFLVPEGWEIVKHAVSDLKGKLIFVDRRNQRLSVNWQKVEGAIDGQRQIKDCLNRDREQDSQGVFSEIRRLRKWIGYSWCSGSLNMSRFGSYEKTLGRWIEMVLVWPDGYDKELENQILESFRAVNTRDPFAVRAFDVDVTPPLGWNLTQARVLPADLVLGFKRAEGEVTIRRVKLAQELQGKSLSSLITAETGEIAIHPQRCNGHDGCVAQSREKRIALRWLWGKRRTRFDKVWRCLNANTTYHLKMHLDASCSDRLDDFVLKCCPTSGR